MTAWISQSERPGKTGLTPRTIVWDIDDVVLDWRGAFHDWLVARGHQPMMRSQDDPDYGLGGAFPHFTPESLRAAVIAFNRTEAYANLPLLPGAEDAVARSRLRAGPGSRLVAITAPGDDVVTRELRLSQIRRFGFDEVRVLPLGSSKTAHLRDVGADLLIDDNPRILAEAVEAGIPVLVRDQSYNRHLSLPRALCWTTCLGTLERAVDGPGDPGGLALSR